MTAIKINLQGEIHGSMLIIDKQTSFDVGKVAIYKLLSLYYLAKNRVDYYYSRFPRSSRKIIQR